MDLMRIEDRGKVYSGHNRVVVDLDGTLIPDEWPAIGELLPGAREAMVELLNLGYEVVVNSTRLARKKVDEQTDRELDEWLTEVATVRRLLDEALLSEVGIWTHPWKPGAVAYIDDKAIRFDGDWSKAVADLKAALGREAPQEPYDAARETLTTAAEYVAGPRSGDYGHPLDNHGRSAALMTTYLHQRGLLVEGAELTEEDVCWLNVQQKIARDLNRPTFDGPVDVAGYAANVAEVRAERDRRSS